MNLHKAVMVVRAAILLIRNNSVHFSCDALDSASFRLLSARARLDLRRQYHDFTCRAGRPSWWNSFASCRQERADALIAFVNHLESQHENQL